MTITNLGRQHQKSLDSYFKSFGEYPYLFRVMHFYFIPSILLNLIIYTISKLILLMFSNSLDNTTTLLHFSY